MTKARSIHKFSRQAEITLMETMNGGRPTPLRFCSNGKREHAPRGKHTCHLDSTFSVPLW